MMVEAKEGFVRILVNDEALGPVVAI